MDVKPHVIHLTPDEMANLIGLAFMTDSVIIDDAGESLPSWRLLIKRIARGELHIEAVGDSSENAEN